MKQNPNSVEILQGQVNRNKTEIERYKLTGKDLLAQLQSLRVKLDQAGIKEYALKQISEGLGSDAAQANDKLKIVMRIRKKLFGLGSFIKILLAIQWVISILVLMRERKL
ncbi:hypothetical protein AGMMS49921_13560 [Endomicrobiia bacterium]|nr:hypothetical protein AGMMS49921_13560 [Endomicrobiia bacterium]